MNRGGVIFHGYGSLSKPALNCILGKHYLKRKPPMTDTFEWRKDNNVLAVATFGVPAARSLQISACRQNPDIVVELNRLWVDDGQPKNTASWFLSQCLSDMPPRIIVSFADTKQNHDGTVYRASNFYYAGWTDMDRKTPRYTWENTETVNDLFGEHTVTKHDRHIKKPENRVYRKPKAKYWTVTGTKNDKKRLRSICDWPEMDWRIYPVPTEHARI